MSDEALDPLADLRARGAVRMRALLDEAGGARSADDVAARLGISRAAVEPPLVGGAAARCAWRDRPRLPACQFEGGTVVPGLAEALGWFGLAEFEQNVFAGIDTVRFFLPGMVEQRFGRVVNITSFVVKELYPNMALSNTVRIALTGAMASLAREVMEHGVTVNNILPGLMDTRALQRVIIDRACRQGGSEAEVRAQMAQSIPAKRLGTAEDFGPLCAFLCSRHAGYITGQNICLDGGLVRALI